MHPANLWAVIIGPHGDPLTAHLIMSYHDHDSTGVLCARTACGLHYTTTHKRVVWWYVPAGELALAEASKNHCGLEFMADATGTTPTLGEAPPTPTPPQ